MRGHVIRDPAHSPAKDRPAKAQPTEHQVKTVSYQATLEPEILAANHAPVHAYPGHCGLQHCRAGCRCGIPAEPLGAALYANMDALIISGKRAQLVLYEYDFQNGPTQDLAALNNAGRRKLLRLLPIMETTGFPLIVEPTADSPELSEARRMYVVNVLSTELWCPDADSLVVVQPPPSTGIRGVEAVEIDRNQLETTRSQGISFSGFDSSGFDTPTTQVLGGR